MRAAGRSKRACRRAGPGRGIVRPALDDDPIALRDALPPPLSGAGKGDRDEQEKDDHP